MARTLSGMTKSIRDISSEMTERLLVDAGISPGMRVLDIGCGVGDVSFLIAALVGEHGQVLGVDRNAGALAIARQRASERNFATTLFVEGDFRALSSEYGSFDAAVSRRVLMYQPDAVEALRALARVVRPGGLLVFQEHDSSIMQAYPTRLPLHESVHGWLWRTVEREGANLHMGFDLAPALTQAGLIVEHVRAEAIVQIPSVHYDIEPIMRAMLPRILQHGVASEKEIDVDTLDQRLSDERRQAKATYIGEMVFCAWARKPADDRSTAY